MHFWGKISRELSIFLQGIKCSAQGTLQGIENHMLDYCLVLSETRSSPIYSRRVRVFQREISAAARRGEAGSKQLGRAITERLQLAPDNNPIVGNTWPIGI